MPTKRQRRQKNEVVKLIVTTRERFPHTPAVTRAMRRVIWRYAAEEEARTRSAAARRKRRARAGKKSFPRTPYPPQNSGSAPGGRESGS